MGNNIFTYVQLGTILTFIGTLFVLYRIYVQQKDATIQLLKEKNEWLQKELEIAKESSPDVLIQRLNDRVKVLTEEIERLSQDKVKNEDVIRQKDKELHDLQVSINKASEKLGRLNVVLRTASEALSVPLEKINLERLPLKEKPPTF